jgi:hypothetical protein
MMIGIGSCKKKEVAPDGLSQKIRNFVSDQTLNQLKQMGLVVHTGQNPPNLEGIYLSSPRILVTTVPKDASNPGAQFADQKIKIYAQNNQALTASLDFKEFSTQDGRLLGQSLGVGAFLAGTDASFTLFIESKGYLLSNNNKDTSRYTFLDVYSGIKTSNGIKDFNNALLMLDDHGDPYDRLIAINTGRLFKDELAENQQNFRIGSAPVPNKSALLPERPAGAASE